MMHIFSSFLRSSDNPFDAVFLPRLYPDYMRNRSAPFGLEEGGASPFTFSMYTYCHRDNIN